MFFKKARLIQELEKKTAKLTSELFDMERRAVEAEHFERLAARKLEKWVGKHDDLLLKHKDLVRSIEEQNQAKKSHGK